MNDITIIIIALAVFAAVVFGMGALIAIVLHRLNKKEFLVEHNPKKTNYSIKKNSEYDAMIAKTIFKIKDMVGADKVTLSRFHNGGFFCNGLEMMKYTVTHETPYGSTYPLQNTQNAILISRYPTAMTTLATFGYWIVHDINDCTDPNFKKDMEHFGFKATYLILIRQLDGSEEGFIGLNWNKSHVIEEDKYQAVKAELPYLLSLVNMAYQPLENK